MPCQVGGGINPPIRRSKAPATSTAMASGLVPRSRASSAATRSAVVGSLRSPAPLWRQPRGIGLGQEAAMRHRGSGRARACGGAEGDRQRKRDKKPGRGHLGRQRRVAGECVEHAALRPRPSEQRRADVVVRVAVVDDHRLAAARRQCRADAERPLAGPPAAIGCGSSRGRSPPPPPPPAPPPDQSAAAQSSSVAAAAKCGWMPTAACTAGMPPRQLDCRTRRRQVVARDEHPLDAGRHGPCEHVLTVAVEGWVLEVAVRIDQPGEPRPVPATGSGLRPRTSSSVRGKRGCASPTVQPAPTAPQEVSCSKPGPPAPRSS